MQLTGKIYGINGPIVYLKGNLGFKMAEMVYVGNEKLVGEVIGLTKDITTIQVFEETTGLKLNLKKNIELKLSGVKRWGKMGGLFLNTQILQILRGGNNYYVEEKRR